MLTLAEQHKRAEDTDDDNKLASVKKQQVLINHEENDGTAKSKELKDGQSARFESLSLYPPAGFPRRLYLTSF